MLKEGFNQYLYRVINIYQYIYYNFIQVLMFGIKLSLTKSYSINGNLKNLKNYKFTPILFLFTGILVFNQSVYPFQSKLEAKIKIDGAVSDVIFFGGKIYIATERGKVEIISLSKKKVIKTISYPKFKDFMGSLQPSKVFSIDVSPDSKTLIAVVQAEKGGREVYIVNPSKNDKPKKLVSRKSHLPIAKVRFVNNNQVVFGLTGDEVVLYDIKRRKVLYRISAGMSFFSDFALDYDKRTLAIADESGDVHIVDIKKGKVIKVLEEMNKDKAFSIDLKSKVVMTGGRDKKASVYNLKTKQKREFLAKDFMVFSVALSPTGRYGAYVYNDKYDVAIVNVSTGDRLGFLKGHKSTPSKIVFINQNLLVIGCDNGEIYIWTPFRGNKK